MHSEWSKHNKSGLPSTRFTLNDTAHLYYPGDNIYNSMLAFDWTGSTHYDIFKLEPELIYAHQRYQEKQQNTNRSGHPRHPSGEYISFLQEEAIKKNKNSFSMDYFLKYISNQTNINYPGKHRLIYIFNCDPRLSGDMSNITYKKVHDIKQKLEKNSLNRWRNFVKYYYRIPPITRQQHLKNTRIMDEQKLYIDEEDHILDQRKGRNILKQKKRRGAYLLNATQTGLNFAQKTARAGIYNKDLKLT